MQVHKKSFNESVRESLSERPNSPLIMLEALTWYKENLGLYDYQASASGLSCQRAELREPCKLYRHPRSGKIEVVTEEEEREGRRLPMEYVYVASVRFEGGACRVQSADVSGEQPHPYVCQEQPEYFRNSHLVVAGLFREGQEGYALEVGALLRLGKLEFEVIEVSDGGGRRRAKEAAHLQRHAGTLEVEAGRLLAGTCKFCLGEEGSARDPLIAPCDCRGSCAVVHVECLRSWVNSKVRREASGQALTYNFSKFECEICGVVFPRAVRLPDRSEVPLLDYLKPARPYVILQSAPAPRAPEPPEQVVYVLSPSEQEAVRVGRGHNCAVRIEDITVSRVHAEVRFSTGRFYIVDCKSKFGTLVKFREEVALKNKLRLQSGRTLLSFSLFQCAALSALSAHRAPNSAQSFKKEASPRRSPQKE